MVTSRLAIAVASGLLLSVAAAPVAVDILNATGGLPAHIVGQFEDPVGFAEATTGQFVVLDRRAHTVYVIDRAKTEARKLVEIGFEKGRVLGPGVLALSRDDIFAVADAPNGVERIQYFSLEGMLLGGFHMPTLMAPRLVIGPMVLNGVGSMSFTGKTFLINRPESGALFSEYDNSGAVVRHIGTLRRTGQEADADVHLAMNVGLPLADPTGGFYFVFMTGIPKFQKYDAKGVLLFERHIEGIELDEQIQSQPTEWPRRVVGDGARLPLVMPVVRAAAVDPSGRLWVSLMVPYTYIYGREGEKTRTVQFRGADIISPASLSFARNGRVLVTPGCYEFSTK